MHDAVKRFQESDSDFSHSLEILFCFLAIVLLQWSEQQPFSYSVILWNGRCGNGALVSNDDAWHETKSSQFKGKLFLSCKWS